jgi:renalase
LRVGIIGAGISGLAAARTLRAADHEVVLFEKAARVGGRCATRPVGDFIFDTGASSIAPRGLSLAKVLLEELPADGLVQVSRPIYTLKGMRVEAGDPSRMNIARYTYLSGNSQLPIRLAADQDVRLDQRIGQVSKSDGKYIVQDERFDALILAIPSPQMVPFLEQLGDSRPVGYISYRPCLSVLLGFRESFPETHYHALIEPEQRHPLTWMSLEHRKSAGRAPEGQTAIVAQLSPEYSRRKFEAPDEEVVNDTVDYLRELAPDLGTPAVSAVKRWKYSQPESVGMFESLNSAGSKVVLAGDGLRGGRVEYAFETGVQAARLLMG